jgi:hypothetical protein
LIIDGVSHALTRAEETSPHDLYLEPRAEASPDDATPRLLRHVGSIGCKLSLRQSLASSGTAASRLKERRGEEEAKRDANRAVLLDGSSLLRTRQSASTASLRAKRPEAGPAAKLRSNLGLAGASRSDSARPGHSAAASRASTPGGGSSLPGSPNVPTSRMAGTGSRPTHPSAITPLSTPRISDLDKQGEGSPPSLRVRLIQLLAPGPLPRRRIVAQLRAPEAQILKLLSNHAHAPAHLQSAGSASLSSSRKFQGPVNRRAGGKAAASPASGATGIGPGTMFALSDTAYLDARLDWPDYDARTRVQVSDAAEAAFDRMHLPTDALPRRHLYPDGRPTAETRAQWERERLAREAVEKMDDGHDLSDAAEDEAEEGALEDDDASSSVADVSEYRGSTDASSSHRMGPSGQDTADVQALGDLRRAGRTALSPQTLSPLKGLGLSGAPASPSASHHALEPGVESADDGSDDVSARTRSARSAGASTKKRKSGSALDRLKKAVKSKGATPVQRTRELERAKARKDKEETFKAAGSSALPAKRIEKSAASSSTSAATRSSSSSDRLSSEQGQLAEQLAVRTSMRQAGDTTAASRPGAKQSLSARAYTDSEDEVSASGGRASSSSKQLRPSAGRLSRSAERASGSTSPTASAHLATGGDQRRSGLPEQPRSSMAGPTRHGVGLGASQSTEPWLDVRNSADWTRLRERFSRVYAEYKAGWEHIQGERRALQAELAAAKGDGPLTTSRDGIAPHHMPPAVGPQLVPLQQERGASAGYAWRHSLASTPQKGPLSFEEVTIALQRQVSAATR